jgi:toluene monooxygenase electron transfer component
LNKITVETNSGVFEFSCAAGEKLLYAGLAEGVALPYECATGTCGTCRGRLTEGSVEVGWETAPGFARLKRAKGDVLMCQAEPSSACRLRVPAKVERIQDPARPMRRKGVLEAPRKLTHDVVEFCLRLSRPMTFRAGQFVTLARSGLAGSRAYSIVNFAPDAERLTFVLKRKPGGGFSDWLFERAAAGDALAVFGPLGRAVFNPAEGRDVVCVAGSSGIAGMMAILAHAREARYFQTHRGRIFFGVRTLRDAFYLADLARHAAQAGGALEVTLALSDEAAPNARHPHFPNLKLASGLVADVMAREIAGGGDRLVAFVAGPVAMVDAAVRHLTLEARLTRAFIRYDKFT